jgi:ATP-dependent exoDNAse (exonuclease V) beta subunit
VNHRSLPAVLAEVERVIAPVMRREVGVQPAFEPLVASEANAARAYEASGRFAGVEHWIVAPWSAESGTLEPTLASDATRAEARALASDLRELRRERGVAWRSVGVLFRSRGDWDVYLTALREAGVPFAVEGDRSYYRRREIIDAAAWVRCVLDPNDSLALVSALRSAAVGVPDAAWVPLFARGLPERVAGLSRPDPDSLAALRSDAAAVAAALPADVPGISRIAGWERNLAAALAAIGALRASFASDPADVFVEKLRAALLLEASEAARFLGPWRVANLERFFRDLSEELAAGADEQDVLRRLRHAVAEEEEMQEEPPHDSAADAVQILTLHGAKGLDFDHVYLMQLHKGTGERRDRPRIDAARVGDGLELRVLGAPSLLFDQVAARRAQVADAERVRLLYVGMTRARERLVLSGAWPAFLQRKTPGMHSLLLEQRRELPDLVDLTRRLADAARAGRSFVDVAGARFVLPVLRVDAEPEPAPVAGAARAEEVAMDAASVIARQRAAEARMARPLGGVASAAEPAGVVGGAGPSRPAGAPPPADAAGGSEQREIARLTGIAVHRAFERLDLTLPAGEALTRAASRLELPPDTHALPAERTAALAAARRLLDGVAGGGRLCERLDRIRQQVVARELPVLLPPDAHDDAVGFVSGTLDLVYRDPDTARFVVVEVKTDAMADDAAALAARAARHARQGEIYRRALREGLGLATEPRFELWFVAADRWIASDPDGSNDPGDPRAPEQMSLSLA